MPIVSVKLLAALLAALTLSLLGNGWQLHLAGKRAAECKAAMELAVKNGELAAAQAAQKVSEDLAEAGRKDHADLLASLDDIAKRAQVTRVVYRKASAAAPLAANCAPGAARVDAVNAGLGGAK